MMLNTTEKEMHAGRLANWAFFFAGMAILCIVLEVWVLSGKITSAQPIPRGSLFFKVIAKGWPVGTAISLVLSIWSLNIRRSRKGIWAAVLGFLLLLAFVGLFVFVRLLQSR